MAVVALLSGKGSPGVTTSGLAMALAWPRPVLLVEADPAGGDAMAGYLRGQMPMDRGLVQVAISARHHRIAEDFAAQLLDIATAKSPVSRVLLAGLADPAQAATVAPVWGQLAAHLTQLGRAETGSDVIVDCGRLATPYPPLPLIVAADVVGVVVRASLRSASTAKPAIAAVRQGLGPVRHDRMALLVVEGGDYRPSEVAAALHSPILGTMPWRPGEAATLSDGVGRITASSALLRAAREIEPAVRERCRFTAPRIAEPAVAAAGRPHDPADHAPQGETGVPGGNALRVPSMDVSR